MGFVASLPAPTFPISSLVLNVALRQAITTPPPLKAWMFVAVPFHSTGYMAASNSGFATADAAVTTPTANTATRQPKNLIVRI